MTRIICGTAGGTISLWINVIDCPSHGGIVSSFLSDGLRIGSVIYCTSNDMGYDIHGLPIFHIS